MSDEKKTSPSPRRAWIEMLALCEKVMGMGSPSPRRAWIEITRGPAAFSLPLGSPSPRRAWIEIGPAVLPLDDPTVALPSEGVD